MTNDLDAVIDGADLKPATDTVDFEPVILAFCCNY